MKQVQTDNYSLAWFKLAECVSRREKERALGVYRLLAYSLHDSAFALQLEGDLLLAFNDNSALEKYRAAIAAYIKQQRLSEAVAVYEHIFLLVCPTIDCLQRVLELYQQLNLTVRMPAHLSALAHAYAKQQDYTMINDLFELYCPLLSAHEQIAVYQSSVMGLIKERAPQEVVAPFLYKLLDLLVAHDGGMALQRILAHLQAVDESLYHQATSYLEKAI